MTHHGDDGEHAAEHAHPDSGEILGGPTDDTTSTEESRADVHTAIGNQMRPVTDAEGGDVGADPDAGREIGGVPDELGIDANEELRTGDASMDADRG